MRTAALALIACLPLAPPLARAVECGDVLEADTVLDHDLECAGDGLVIGAHRITVDLNGHTIADIRPYPRARGSESVGIRNPGHHAVAIRGGVVRNFETAVLLEAAMLNRVWALELSQDDWGTGVALVRSRLNRLTAQLTSPHFRGRAIALSDSSDNWLAHNDLDVFEGEAIVLEKSHRNRVSDNRLDSDCDALYLADSHRNRIRRNVLLSGNCNGIYLFSSHHNRVEGNDVLRAEAPGLGLAWSHWNLIRRNRIRSSSTGIDVSHSSHSRVRGNDVADCEGAGIRLVAGTSARIVGNRLDGNRGDGILVDAASGRTLVARNATTGNRDDGLDIRDPSATLRGNEAYDNGDYGIEAVPGVRDLGGNLASGNGNPAQCLNVVCE